MTTQRFEPLSLPLFGTRVIEASAGTGKTYSIALLYVRALLERRLSVREILVVTFTRAATAELRDRIRERVREAREVLRTGAASEDPIFEALLLPYREGAHEDALLRLGAALDELDCASIFTIDGFCQRVLSEHAFSSGARFDAELITDESALLDGVTHDLWVRRYANADLAHVRRAVLSRKELRALLKHALAHRDLALEPAPCAEDEVDRARARFEAAASAYLNERAAFADPAEILALVKKARPLVRSVTATHGLDALARGESRVSASLPEKWDYLSAADLATKAKGPWAPHALFVAVDSFVDAAQALYRASLAAEAAWFVREAKPAFDAVTIEKGRSTFASVLVQLEGALRDGDIRGVALARALGSSYGLALVDECQDTSETQFAVFSAVFREEKHGLLFIGDPKQAIYGFRGADVHAYLGARNTAAARYEMEKNFRSSPALLAALGALYDEAESPFGEVDIRYTPVTAGRSADSFDTIVEHDVDAPVLDVLFVPSSEKRGPQLRESDVVADDVARLLNQGARRTSDGTTVAVAPRDIAVLCRSNGLVDAVATALRRRGVPAVSASRRSVFRSDEAEALECVLRAVADPKDGRALRAAWISSIVGGSAQDAAVLRDDDDASSRAVQAMADVREAWLRFGVGAALRRFFDERRLEERLLRLPGGFRRVTNVGHLLELVADAESRLRLSPSRLVGWLARAREGDDDTDEGERALRLEYSGNAVRVLTVHKSKGLEYDVVYVVGLDVKTSARGDRTHAEIVRAESGERVLVADTRLTGPHQQALAAASFEEGARSAYVGLTRAKLAVRVVVKAQAKDVSSAGLVTQPLGRVLLGGVDLPPQQKDGAVDGQALYELLADKFEGLRARGLAVRVRSIDEVTYERHSAKDASLALVTPPESGRVFRHALAVASFSRLVSGAPHAPAVDHDRPAEVDPALPLEEDPLASLPGGTALGHLVHGVFEYVDFANVPETLPASIARAVAARPAFAGSEAILESLVSRTLATPVFGNGAGLAGIPAGRTLRELEFELLAEGRGSLTAGALARIFLRFGDEVERRYAGHVESLPFRSIEGFLHGFVNLIVEHEGLYYVADYKTNRLGALVRYAPRELAGPMTTSHYLLQSSLYLLALHRLLRHRVSGYSYETHVGGSLYLFVRGMSPSHPRGHGVFRHHPSPQFVDALDRLFDGDAS